MFTHLVHNLSYSFDSQFATTLLATRARLFLSNPATTSKSSSDSNADAARDGRLNTFLALIEALSASRNFTHDIIIIKESHPSSPHWWPPSFSSNKEFPSSQLNGRATMCRYYTLDFHGCGCRFRCPHKPTERCEGLTPEKKRGKIKQKLWESTHRVKSMVITWETSELKCPYCRVVSDFTVNTSPVLCLFPFRSLSWTCNTYTNNHCRSRTSTAQKKKASGSARTGR